MIPQTTEPDYRFLFENNPQPLWLYDVETLRFLDVNQSAVNKYGYSREEFLSMTIKDIRPPEDVPALMRKLQGHDHEPEIPQTWRHRRKDGSIIMVEIYSRSLNVGGREAHFVHANDVTDRVIVEQALTASEERFRKLMETTAAAIFFYFDDRFHYVNQATERITGYSRDELSQMSILDVVHPDDKEIVRERSKARLRGANVPSRYEIKIVTKNRDVRWIDLAAGLVQMDGQTAIVATGIDITESRRMVEELRRSEELTHRILEAVPGGIIEVSLEGRIMQANIEAQRCFGFTALDFLECLPGDLAKRIVREDGTGINMEDFPATKCLATGEDQPSVTLGIKVRNEICWAVFSAVPLTDIATGKPNGAVLTFLDITGRKKIEDALRQSEERYRKFFEDDITGDFIADPNGKLLACNPAFATIFGFNSVDEAMRSNLKLLYAESHAFNGLVELLRNKQKIEYHEAVGKRVTGKPLYMIENLIGLTNADGTIYGVKGYVFDITSHKLLEQQMMQTAKIEGLGRLAGGIAHDFNNLLGIILGYSERLSSRKDIHQGMLDDVSAIHTTAQRGADLVKQLLTLARKKDISFGEMNVNSIVEELGNLLKETFPRNIVFNVQTESAMPPIIGDGNQIHQAVLNLCVNARDAMPGGGTITIKTEMVAGIQLRDKFPQATEDCYTCISVMDTGKGVEDAIRNEIFEPFFSTKGPGSGTGLGLAVVHGIVNSHHGFIDFISKPRKGATFKLFFPVSRLVNSGNGAQSVEHREVIGGKETILVVEDEELLRNLVRATLESKGYSVLLAEDGEKAVAVFKEHHERISLVLSDLGLPKLGGWEACKQIRKINPDARIIIASGYLDPEAKQEMIQQGIHNFIQKPYLITELMARMRELLDGAIT